MPKVATLNINASGSGVQAVEVPKGSVFHNAHVTGGGPIQVNYSHDDGPNKEMAEFQVVQNGQNYGNDFDYLDKLVSQNNQVTHVVYKSSSAFGGRGPGGAHATPI